VFFAPFLPPIQHSRSLSAGLRDLITHPAFWAGSPSTFVRSFCFKIRPFRVFHASIDCPRASSFFPRNAPPPLWRTKGGLSLFPRPHQSLPSLSPETSSILWWTRTLQHFDFHSFPPLLRPRVLVVVTTHPLPCSG